MAAIFLAGQGLLQAEASIDYPRADRLVTGKPKRFTQNLYNHGPLNCGIWECEVGAWNIQFAENQQEFFSVISGRLRIHDAKTQSYIEVSAGESGIIPASFIGKFEVLEAVKKYFVLSKV